MTMKSLLALILLIIMLVSAAACAPSSPSVPDGSETAEYTDTESVQETVAKTEAPEETEKRIVLFEDGKWNYRIVTRSLRSNDEVNFSFALTTEMNTLIGSAPHSANDTALKGEEVNEIIIGYSKHPEMRALYSELGYGTAQITVKGNKIYIAAYTAEGYDALQKHLKKLLKSGKTNGKLELSVKELETQITINEDLNRIPTATKGSFSCISNCGYGQTLVVIGESSKNDFDSYVEKLKDYSCVSSTNESGNASATFDFGSHILNVSFSKHDNGLRIILNKNAEPTELFQKPEKAEKICEPMIIMHGLAWRQAGYTYYNYGMCYLIRLSDGRFIVIDGGFNRKKDADDLYALLKKYTPNQDKPTIAMWIITHAHIDHHGTFALQFLTHYKNSVTVENVMFNPPGGGILTDPENETVLGLMNGHITLNNAIKIYKANNIRSHVGDRYYVGDAIIDVLYTVDYQYPKNFNYYNTSSMILSIKLAGQRIMITGDASNDAFDKAVKMYGASLKSDILQPAHHGGYTGVDNNSALAVAEGYKMMSPSVVLWPAGDDSQPNAAKHMFNKVLLSLPTIKKVVVAGDRDFAVTLPYNP